MLYPLLAPSSQRPIYCTMDWTTLNFSSSLAHVLVSLAVLAAKGMDDSPMSSVDDGDGMRRVKRFRGLVDLLHPARADGDAGNLDSQTRRGRTDQTGEEKGKKRRRGGCTSLWKSWKGANTDLDRSVVAFVVFEHLVRVACRAVLLFPLSHPRPLCTALTTTLHRRLQAQ